MKLSTPPEKFPIKNYTASIRCCNRHPVLILYPFTGVWAFLVPPAVEGDVLHVNRK